MAKKHSCGFCDEEWVCSNDHNDPEPDAQNCRWEDGFPCLRCVMNVCRPDTPWIKIYFKEIPNTVRCDRCGASQDCESNISLDKYVHDMDYFAWRHKDCEEKDGAEIQSDKGEPSGT